MNTLARLLLLAAAVLSAGPAYPQNTDKPLIRTEILSDRFRGENDGQQAYFLFEGNVVLNATNLELKCDQLEVFTLLKDDENNDARGKVAIGVFSSIERIVAGGNVEITQDQRYAMAETAEVQPNEERIVLSGDPIIRQAGYEFSNPGGELIIDRGQGRISTPGERNARVRLIGPPISDLGFEPDEEPEVTPEEPESPETDASPENAESGTDEEEDANREE